MPMRRVGCPSPPVSAINGCGMCIDAHECQLREALLGVEAIRAAVRIAGVVHAIAGMLDGEDTIAVPSQQAPHIRFLTYV